MFAIVIANERMRVGGGVEWRDLPIVLLSCNITDLCLCQHCNGNGKEEVCQDAMLRMAHELYFSSCFHQKLMANGKVILMGHERKRTLLPLG